MPLVQGDDGSRRSIRSGKESGCSTLDGYILVVVPAVDFKSLVVGGLVVDVDLVNHFD